MEGSAATASDIHHPFARPPATGTTIEVAPGVHWLRMPLPFALDHINLWLLEDGDGWTIVDCGYGLDEVKLAWDEVFAATLGGKPVTRLLVTHFHPDHMGLAAWHCDRWGLMPVMTLAEWLSANMAVHGHAPANFEARLAFFARHGVPDSILDEMRADLSPYARGVPALPAGFRRIRDGDEIEIGGRTWRTITAQGHAPEHACYYCAEIGVLISGDQILPKITPNISVAYSEPLADPLALYLDSLATFEPLPADTLVLPSHQRPFTGLQARLAGLAAHHEARLADALAACETRGHTAFELLPVLFRRKLDTHQTSFAIGESLAHLHHLVARGRIWRDIDAEGQLRFHLSD